MESRLRYAWTTKKSKNVISESFTVSYHGICETHHDSGKVTSESK